MLKKWIALAMAAVFVLSISGAAMAAGKLVKVPTAWMDEHETFLIWYAKEKGWDKEAGLDVEIKYFNSGADILNALPSGEWVFAGMGAVPDTSQPACDNTALHFNPEKNAEIAQKIAEHQGSIPLRRREYGLVIMQHHIKQ